MNLLMSLRTLARVLTNPSINIESTLSVMLLPSGRLHRLTDEVALAVLIERVKKHLNLKNIRLALGVSHTLDSLVKTIVLCAGSGGSVVKNSRADVILTGEMSHHEVIAGNSIALLQISLIDCSAAVHNGTSVILCEHSNTERGYLPVFRDKLAGALDEKVQVLVSADDADPLVMY